MGHVRSRGFLGRVALFALLVAAAATLPGIARAAIPSGGVLAQPLAQSTSWEGQLYVVGTVSDPRQCQSQAADPGNVVCDHYQLDVQTAGQVEVVITWPNLTPDITVDDSDFDLLICDNSVIEPDEILDPFGGDRCSLGTEVAFSESQNPSGEQVVFQAEAKTYEVRVLPFSVFLSDYDGCAAYVSAPNACPFEGGGGSTDPVPAAEFFAGCTDTAPAGERELDGNGQVVPVVETSNPPHISMKAERDDDDDPRGRGHGKVYYKGHGDDNKLRSEQITCVGFTDTALTPKDGSDAQGRGRAELRGTARWRPTVSERERRVCFRSVGEDNGPRGNADRFELEVRELLDGGTPNDPSDDACGPPSYTDSGTIQNGDIDYEIDD